MAKVVKRRTKDTQSRRSINWVLIGGIVLVGVVALFALLFLSLQEPEIVDLRDFCADNEENCVAFGPEDATVTVIEVYDYACPSCGVFTLSTADEIAESYFNHENVRWVYFPYSLPQYRNLSTPTSAAALCMAEQGGDLFHEFHQGMFAIQTAENAHTRPGFEQVAAEIGADEEAFVECLDDGRYRNAVQENIDVSGRAEIDATPSFFVNGEKFTNIGAFQQIEQLVEPLLQ
jgi:protein-disulfide isomerase